MCGIVGIASSPARPVDDAVLRSMNDALWHRGPDDEGYLVRERVSLGMRRLSIIDVAGGRQPIHNEDKSVWAVFNGEIYNHDELREDLQRRGHHFYTKSDTETLVHLYEEFGDEGVRRLRGMFAYALWDERRNRLFVARDRLGIKPLYYGRFEGRLYFGSELRAFRRVPGFPHRLNPASVERYLAYLYVPGPETIWRDVIELPPAHYLVYDGDAVTVHRYWDVQYREGERTASPAEWQQRFLAQFRSSVKSHLMSEVPLGAFLSGGIDSSAMVAVMAQESGNPVKTFSIGYEGEGSFQDERAYARIVADRYGTDHREFVVSPNVADLLPDLVDTMEQPFADSSVIPTYYVSKLTRQHVTVALSGLGGDEIGGGYQRYLGMLWAERYERLPRALRPRWLEAAVGRLPDVRSGRRWIDQAKRFFATTRLGVADRYAAMVTTFSVADRRRLLGHDFGVSEAGDPEELVTRVFRSGDADSVLNAAMLADLGSYLPGDLLALADRISMRHSLEVRVPFLDHPLVELMATAPGALKVHGRTKKVLMREAFQGFLPPSILGRRKMGFSVPLGLWLRTDLRVTMQEILSEAEIRRLGYLRHAEVERIKAEHLAGRANHESKLWALINLVSWHCRAAGARA